MGQHRVPRGTLLASGDLGSNVNSLEGCWESHLPLLGLVKGNQWPTPFLQYLLWISQGGVRNLGFNTIIVTKTLYAFEINILNLFFLISSF